MDLTDEELMSNFKEGDMSALEGIFGRYKLPVFNFALRYLANRAEAEDVAGEVFLAVVSGRYRYSPDAKFSTWLFTVTKNACLSRLRGGKRFLSLWFKNERGEETEIPIPGEGVSANDELVKKDHSAFLEKAISRLPVGQREAILLREFQEMNYEDIAKVMDCSLSNVKILIFRGRENLRRELKGAGLEV